MRPRLLLLDEPLSALDTGLRERLAADLRAILREAGTTALMVTHDHEEAFAVADRLAVMRAGPDRPAGRHRRGLARRRSTRRPRCSSATPGCSRAPRPTDVARGGRVCRAPPAVAVRRSALAVDDDGPLDGVVRSGRATPEQIRLVVDVDGVGEVDAVARLDDHPGPGDRVSLAVDPKPAGRRYRAAPLTGHLLYTDVRVSPRLDPDGGQRRRHGRAGGPRRGRLDKRLVDPEGSFLGPSYIRLPLLLLGALLLDLLPRTLWYSWRNPKLIPAIVRDRWRTHWNRERITLVALGIVCFYVVYVSYRNLKSFLPFVSDTKYDRELHLLDHALLFGHDPATLLHTLLGDGLHGATCCPTSTCGSCRWCRWSSPPGWSGRATCPTATGS